MENWRRTFLKRMEQELAPYCVDSIFLEEEEQNPDTLRQMFELGEKESDEIAPVVMDMAVFLMEDGSQLLQIYTELALNVEESPALIAKINELNLPIPLGNFGYFAQERQLYHKYNQLVKEPEDLESFVTLMLDTVDIVVGIVKGYYRELLATVKEA